MYHEFDPKIDLFLTSEHTCETWDELWNILELRLATYNVLEKIDPPLELRRKKRGIRTAWSRQKARWVRQHFVDQVRIEGGIKIMAPFSDVSDDLLWAVSHELSISTRIDRLEWLNNTDWHERPSNLYGPTWYRRFIAEGTFQHAEGTSDMRPLSIAIRDNGRPFLHATGGNGGWLGAILHAWGFEEVKCQAQGCQEPATQGCHLIREPVSEFGSRIEFGCWEGYGLTTYPPDYIIAPLCWTHHELYPARVHLKDGAPADGLRRDSKYFHFNDDIAAEPASTIFT